MLIIGLDIGRANTGIVVWSVEDKRIVVNETLKLNLNKMRKEYPENPQARRLSLVEEHLYLLLNKLKNKDERVFAVIEDYAYSADNIWPILKSKKSAGDKIKDILSMLRNMDRDPFALSEVHGVIYSQLAMFKIPYVKVAPTQMKRFIAGKGNADKPEIMHILSKAYEVLDDDHQFDALALCHMGRYYVAWCKNSKSLPSGYKRETITSIALDDRHLNVTNWMGRLL